MLLVDTHCHLHFPDFQSDFDQVIERSKSSGVRIIINVGTDVASSKESIALAERFDFVYAAVGIHPHDADKATDADFAELNTLVKHPKVVAIGEVGLDFYKHFSTEAAQRKVLLRFFELAKETGLPLILHIRDAYQEALELLRAHFKAPIQAVSHCFSGDRKTMEEFVKLGIFISFAGPVTYKKSDALREAAQACPVDKILTETDAPFLAPQAFRGNRNEPAYMVETARFIAELKQIPLEILSRQMALNSEALFRRKWS